VRDRVASLFPDERGDGPVAVVRQLADLGRPADVPSERAVWTTVTSFLREIGLS